VDKRHKQKGKKYQSYGRACKYIYRCSKHPPKKKGCLGQQLASMNHAKVLKGRATVHEWWYDLKKPTRNQYLTWMYLFMGCPTWWTLPVRKMPFQLICWPSLDRNFRSAINNRLDRGRIFLPKVQKKLARPENCTWKLGLTQAWSHIGLGLDKNKSSLVVKSGRVRAEENAELF